MKEDHPEDSTHPNGPGRAESIPADPEIVDGRWEARAWQELGMSRLEAEWANPQDAIYDDRKNLDKQTP